MHFNMQAHTHLPPPVTHFLRRKIHPGLPGAISSTSPLSTPPPPNNRLKAPLLVPTDMAPLATDSTKPTRPCSASRGGSVCHLTRETIHLPSLSAQNRSSCTSRGGCNVTSEAGSSRHDRWGKYPLWPKGTDSGDIYHDLALPVTVLIFSRASRMVEEGSEIGRALVRGLNLGH